MADQQKKTIVNDHDVQEKISIPDFSELWKELYFKTESAWAEAFREFISTKTFVNMMDNMLAQHLFNEKITRQNLERYFEATPMPSKKDIARVAELVISLEEKIDSLEIKSIQALQSMAESLIKMVDYQDTMQKELAALSQENQALHKRLDALINQPEAPAPEKKPTRKKAPPLTEPGTEA